MDRKEELKKVLDAWKPKRKTPTKPKKEDFSDVLKKLLEKIQS